jgi:hypothetical protein
MKGVEWPSGRSTPNQGGTTKRVKPSSLNERDEGFCVFKAEQTAMSIGLEEQKG